MIEYFTDSEFFIVVATNRKEFKEIELLFLSRSIPFIVGNDLPGKGFIIPLNYENFVANEIRLFQQENENWPPPPPERSKESLFSFSLVHLLVVLGLAYFHWRTTQVLSSINWLETGKFSADKVLAGEWGRTVTALTLHVDDPHLLSNFFGLLLFVSGVNQFVGIGVSWLLVLLSGAVGNYLNALFYQTAHNAIGASTAVFGAVGVMGSLAAKKYLSQKGFQARFFVPVIASLGIFAMLGTSLQTDVMAHLCGFISGLAIGLLAIPLIGSRILKNSFVQLIAFAVFLGIIHYAWNIQIQSS